MRYFLDRVAIPGGDFDCDRALLFDDRLATQSAVLLQARCFLDSVEFFIFRFTANIFALFEIHMAGGTSANTAASVFDIDPGIERDFEHILPDSRHHGALSLVFTR